MNRSEYWSLFVRNTDAGVYGYVWTGWFPGTVEVERCYPGQWALYVTHENGGVTENAVGTFQQVKRAAIALVAEHGEA